MLQDFLFHVAGAASSSCHVRMVRHTTHSTLCTPHHRVRPRVQAWRKHAASSRAKSTSNEADNHVADAGAAAASEPAAPLEETSAPDHNAAPGALDEESSSPPPPPSPAPVPAPAPSPMAIEVEAEVEPNHRIPSPSPRGVEAFDEGDEAFEGGAMIKANLIALPPPAMKVNADPPKDVAVRPAAPTAPTVTSASSKFTMRCVFVWLVIPLVAAVLAMLANPEMANLVGVDMETLVRVPGPLESAWESAMSSRPLSAAKGAKASGVPSRTPPAASQPAKQPAAKQQPAKQPAAKAAKSTKSEANGAPGKARGGWRRKKAAAGV